MSVSSLGLFRSSRKRAAVCLSLAMLALGGSALHLSTNNEAMPAESTIAPLSLRFNQGSVLRYRAEWSGTQRGRMFQGGGQGGETHSTTKVDMALDLELFVESVRKDDADLVLSITSVDRHKLNVLGSDVFPTQEAATSALVGKRARVRIGNDGTAREVSFERGAEGAFSNVVQWIVREASISLAGSKQGSTWETDERGAFGNSRVQYIRKNDAIERKRSTYLKFDAFAAKDMRDLVVKDLKGATELRLRESGELEQVHSQELIRVDARTGGLELEGNLRFNLDLIEVIRQQAPLAAINYGSPIQAGEPVVDADARAELLNQRIDGLTREQLLGNLTQFGNGGLMPEHTRWLWRATGLLKKDPKIAAELAKIALRPEATDKARALVLDLLASAGHADAQAAMRAVLTSGTLARSGSRPVLLQRLSLLDTPEPATVDVIWDSYREGKQKGWKDLAFASAHALAAASGSASQLGDDHGAHLLVRRLATEIDAAETPEARATMLGALGNTSHPETANIAKTYATSEDVDLREAAADAVRNVDTKAATDMLIALLSDSNRQVQGAALASLAERKLGDSEWSRIAVITSSGKLGTGLDGAVLNLASKYLGKYGAVEQVIARVAANDDSSPATKARARALLEQATG